MNDVGNSPFEPNRADDMRAGAQRENPEMPQAVQDAVAGQSAGTNAFPEARATSPTGTDRNSDDPTLIAHDVRYGENLIIHQDNELTNAERAAITDLFGPGAVDKLPEEVWTFDIVDSLSNNDRVGEAGQWARPLLGLLPWAADYNLRADVLDMSSATMQDAAEYIGQDTDTFQRLVALHEVTHKVSYALYGTEITRGQHEILAQLSTTYFNEEIGMRLLAADMANPNVSAEYGQLQMAGFLAVLQSLDNLGIAHPSMTQDEYLDAFQREYTHEDDQEGMIHALYSLGMRDVVDPAVFNELSRQIPGAVVDQLKQMLPDYVLPDQGAFNPDIPSQHPDSQYSGTSIFGPQPPLPIAPGDTIAYAPPAATFDQTPATNSAPTKPNTALADLLATLPEGNTLSDRNTASLNELSSLIPDIGNLIQKGPMTGPPAMNFDVATQLRNLGLDLPTGGQPAPPESSPDFIGPRWTAPTVPDIGDLIPDLPMKPPQAAGVDTLTQLNNLGLNLPVTF